ncbi:MAG: hypothetical protein O4965_21400, partial [Trichodesmium sp. St19_bin1]|nr:hypothetical protein [Trichodesmium sp. St7_bin2_1]MDE5122471.1 hypothetical protein [Trichodesmium sp. St19_bin1]
FIAVFISVDHSRDVPKIAPTVVYYEKTAPIPSLEWLGVSTYLTIPGPLDRGECQKIIILPKTISFAETQKRQNYFQ